MNRLPFVLMLALVPLLVGCNDDDDPTVPEPTTYSLTFSGDATFQGAHGGQTLTVAIVDDATGTVVAEDSGTISAEADPSFEFMFPDAVADGASYHLDYWIDSNFGEGTEGVCDPPEVDHQWRLDVGTINGDVLVDDTHRPLDVESVCATFE